MRSDGPYFSWYLHVCRVDGSIWANLSSLRHTRYPTHVLIQPRVLCSDYNQVMHHSYFCWGERLTITHELFLIPADDTSNSHLRTQINWPVRSAPWLLGVWPWKRWGFLPRTRYLLACGQNHAWVLRLDDYSLICLDLWKYREWQKKNAIFLIR